MVSALLLFGYLTGSNRFCVFQHKHMPAYCRTARHGVLAAAYDKIILCKPIGNRTKINAPQKFCQLIGICGSHSVKICAEESHSLALFDRIDNVYEPAEAVQYYIQQPDNKSVHSTVIRKVHFKRTELRHADAFCHPVIKCRSSGSEKSTEGLTYKDNIVKIKILCYCHNRLFPLNYQGSTVYSQAFALSWAFKKIYRISMLTEILTFGEKFLIA